jgi:dynein heavy chain
MPKKLPRGVTRCIYFLKNKPIALSMEEPDKDVVMCDMGPEPLEHLERMLGEVYLPLLSNPANQEGWGEVG